VRRDELAHILRAACDITNDPEILVIGSQAILASFSEDQLPANAVMSIEADIAFLDDADDGSTTKADLVDGGIGESSLFHASFGIYGQGVDLSTAHLPEGWRTRLVQFVDPQAGSSRAVCLEPHDLVVAKLVAGRPKDHDFALALLESDLIDARTLVERAELLDELPTTRRRVLGWIEKAAEGL
jgi:hypothetical protein